MWPKFTAAIRSYLTKTSYRNFLPAANSFSALKMGHDSVFGEKNMRVLRKMKIYLTIWYIRCKLVGSNFVKILQFWLRRKFKSRTAILASSKVGTKESEAEVCFFLKLLKLCLISTHQLATAIVHHLKREVYEVFRKDNLCYNNRQNTLARSLATNANNRL